jgi:hypothetical protein
MYGAFDNSLLKHSLFLSCVYKGKYYFTTKQYRIKGFFSAHPLVNTYFSLTPLPEFPGQK